MSVNRSPKFALELPACCTQVIKLYAWEAPMEHVIVDLREKELALIRKAALLRTLSDVFNSGSPFLVALSTFTTFIMLEDPNTLTPDIAFVSLSLFNQLRFPMSQVAELIIQTVQVKILRVLFAGTLSR
ncbi:unnamed protein product [Haemonchus placei]|uniref:ABC transmembrane type-1 domain-containing protein n=1 Tax=Haemonchus placei TaxID=6290 RepID=A0A0N4W5W4_HAEPC|nr:unnamed protein product [Haemonchus placei]